MEEVDDQSSIVEGNANDGIDDQASFTCNESVEQQNEMTDDDTSDEDY